MAKETILKELKKLKKENDSEIAHARADELICSLLLELGHEDIVKEYNKVQKWYS